MSDIQALMFDLKQITRSLNVSANQLCGYITQNSIPSDSSIYAAWLKVELALVDIHNKADASQPEADNIDNKAE